MSSKITTGRASSTKSSSRVATKQVAAKKGMAKKAPARSFRSGSLHAEAQVRSGRSGRGKSNLEKIGFEGLVNPRKDARPHAEEPLVIVKTHLPVHPGEILREEFMVPLHLTAYAIAKACKMNRSKVERIAREDLGISGDTAVRFGRYFGNSPQFWMNLQGTYEVQQASRDIGKAVNEIEPMTHEAA